MGKSYYVHYRMVGTMIHNIKRPVVGKHSALSPLIGIYLTSRFIAPIKTLKHHDNIGINKLKALLYQYEVFRSKFEKALPLLGQALP